MSDARPAVFLDRDGTLITETGYLADSPPFLTEYDAGYLPRDKVVLAVTGSQGEPRSALSRIASGDHRSVTLEAGDVEGSLGYIGKLPPAARAAMDPWTEQARALLAARNALRQIAGTAG